MKEEQIKREVLRYLQDDNYRYAILIDGEWGCGKTYFVLHGLKEAMEEYEGKHKHRRIRYVSLYGCKSVEAVEENVCWSILDEKFYESYDKIARTDDSHGEKRRKKKRNGAVLYGTAQKVIGTAMQKLGLPYGMYDYVADFMALDKNIFLFDDLERCNCSINDILGYINGLVEHEGAKVILIANEKEIGSLARNEQKELQYLAAAQKEIKIPVEDSLVTALRGNRDYVPELNVEELERRRKKLFAYEEYDRQYQKIREKLVGITLQYETDHAAVMHQLIHNSGKEKEIQEILHNHVNYFMQVMGEKKHHNLRTFQFFLSKIDYLYEMLQSMDIEEKFREKVRDFVAENCFLLCVEFKGNIQKPEAGYEKIYFENQKRLQSIDNYVRYSICEEKQFYAEIQQYVSEELSHSFAPGDPYLLLRNEYYIKPQSWVEEKLRQIQEKLSKNEYPISTYSVMLRTLVQLKNIGFDGMLFELAVESMMKNAENATQLLCDDYVTFDEEDAREYRALIRKINSVIKGSQDTYHTRTIQEMVEDGENWAQELLEYVKVHDVRHQAKVISRAGAEAWIERIRTSDPAQIQTFRECLEYIYPDTIIKQNVQEDIRTLRQIEKGLLEDTRDLIVNAQIKWLKGQIDQICKLYEIK